MSAAGRGAPRRERGRRVAAKVAILGHGGRPQVRRAVVRLAARLERRGCRVQIAEPHHASTDGAPLARLAAWCDVLLSLGGDGTALRGARALAGRRGVLLPVNLGGLGFLTVADATDLDQVVRAALDGAWETRRTRMLSASVRRRDRLMRPGPALNDVVIKTSGGQAALHLRIHALGADLGHLVADGLITATPSGSTAYALSAGGPVLSPEVQAWVVAPVCPHTLASRPLVMAAADKLTARVIGAPDPMVLLLDGQERVDLLVGDEVEIGFSRRSVRVFENPGRPFGYALRAKLGWQGSEQRSMR